MFFPGDRVRYIYTPAGHRHALTVGQIYTVKYQDEGWVRVENDPNDPEGWDEISYRHICFEHTDPTNTVQHCIVEMVKSAPKRKAKKCSKSET